MPPLSAPPYPPLLPYPPPWGEAVESKHPTVSLKLWGTRAGVDVFNDDDGGNDAIDEMISSLATWPNSRL